MSVWRYICGLHLLLCLVALAGGARSSTAAMLEDFSSIAGWESTASDGVEVSIHPDAGAMRIDVDFRTGAGYCVIRREVALELPKNFAISFRVRTDPLSPLPPNNLELKLIAPEVADGVDVWWVNRRAFAFPMAWQSVSSRRHRFEFAWGPSGGDVPLEHIAAIEIAIAAAEGGAGSVWIDDLALELLPVIEPYTAVPRVRASSGTDEGRSTWRDAPDLESVHWTSASGDDTPWFEVDFQQIRALGGLVLRWSDCAAPSHYHIDSSLDGVTWNRDSSREEGDGGRDALYLPETIARYVRVDIESRASSPITLESFLVLSPEAGENLNAFVHRLASDAPSGWFPEYFRDRQNFWTVVGAPDATYEALINEHGVIEIAKGGPTLEPFITTNDRLISWAGVTTSQSLIDERLPIATVIWDAGDLSLEVMPVADTRPDASRIVVRYRVRNRAEEARGGQLALAFRPFQVLPPWQRLNLTGGVSPIHRISRSGQALEYDGNAGPRALTTPSRIQLVRFDEADIVRGVLAEDRVDAPSDSAKMDASQAAIRDADTSRRTVDDPMGLASGVFMFPFHLAPDDTSDFYVEIPLHAGFEPSTPSDPRRVFDGLLSDAIDTWGSLLSRSTISLPPSASRITETMTSNLAYILINRDGAAIQPGSRTYERSWIRDGCMTSAALLALGHHDVVREYLQWYASFQFPSGKVPCVVDRRGPDPVDEHDSTGQLIHAFRTYGDITGDTGFLRSHFHNVVAGVGYLSSLRAQRLTSEYADPDSPLHSRYGLVPESISHEGYSAKPMHSYWDDFFVLRGLVDATSIARTLEEEVLAIRYELLAEEFRTDLYDSIALTMAQRDIKYVPGCVELGDFDATSTAIAIHPIGEFAHMPQLATRRTFERYWEFFLARRADAIQWDAYTPYEARIIGALVVMDQPERAHALLDWLLLDLHPAPWNHWAEVAYRDERHPGWFGDMPHTWVGAGFINSVIAMLAYTRARDDALVLGAGIKPEWLVEGEGVAVERLYTRHGVLTYRIAQEGDEITFWLGKGVSVPAGGVVLRVPGDRSISSAVVDGVEIGANSAREIVIRQVPAEGTIVLGR